MQDLAQQSSEQSKLAQRSIIPIDGHVCAFSQTSEFCILSGEPNTHSARFATFPIKLLGTSASLLVTLYLAPTISPPHTTRLTPSALLPTTTRLADHRRSDVSATGLSTDGELNGDGGVGLELDGFLARRQGRFLKLLEELFSQQVWE